MTVTAFPARLALFLATVALVVGSTVGMAPSAVADSPAAAGAAPTHLTVGQLGAPVDVENLTSPLLGWNVGAGMQGAYEVQVASTPAGLASPDVWDSGQVVSSMNSSVRYAGPTLAASGGYSWRVRTWDLAGNASAWSAAASFGTGPGPTWSGANAIWTTAVPGLSVGDFTYTGTFNISAVAASINFREKDTSNFYMWQFRTDGTLKEHVNVAGTFTVLGQPSLPLTPVAGTDYDFKIVTVGSSISTYIKASTDPTWLSAGTVVNSTYAAGALGFRTGSTEGFSVDNLQLTDSTGAVRYSNDFSVASNTDFSACGTIASGRLSIGVSKNCAYLGAGSTSNNWAFLRGNVTLRDTPVAWAHLYVTAGSTSPARQFVAKTSLNGTFVGVGPSRPVGSETRYDGYDVTSMVTPGAVNTVGALAYTSSDQRYEARLIVRYADGTTQTFDTGAGWKALNGSSALPDGGSIGTSYYTAPKENFQAAKYPFGYDLPGFDDSAWPAATVKTGFTGLVATPDAKVGQVLEKPVKVVEYSAGNYFIDYGRTWIGGLALNLTSTASRTIDIRYGQVTSAANTVKYVTSAGNTYEDLWALRAGSNPLQTWGPRVFRYVNVLGAPSGLSAADFMANAYIYPFDTSLATFSSSSANLNQVWQLSKNTVESLNLNGYVDSYERERGFYEADDYIQMMSNLYTGGDSTLGTYSTLYLLANRTWPTEWPFYVILSLHDTYLTTGDSSTIAQYYAALQGKLPDKWYNATTGMINKTTGTSCSSSTDCDIVDWPAGDRDGYVFSPYNTVINAISYRAYADMADIATALGKGTDAAAYAAKAASIRAGLNTLMWNASKGAYSDGSTDGSTAIAHWAVQATAFAVAMGVATPSQAGPAAAYLGSRGMACSVYCADFMVQAAYLGNNPDVGTGFMASTATNSWMAMIAQGAGATMEAWNLTDKPNTTYSHPWASSPASNIPQYLFGINPTTPGYDTFDIRPQAASAVTWAHITVPTPKGQVGAAYDTASGRTDVGAYVPANSTARIYVPAASAGATSVYLDGRNHTAVYDNGYLRVDNVPPGCHVLSTAAGAGPGLDSNLTSVCPGGYVAPVDSLSITGSASPAANVHGWNNSDVTVTFTCTDPASTIRSCSSPDTLSSEGADQSSTGQALNASGNVASTTVSGINIDKTAPTLTGTPTSGPNALGWYRSDVTVHWAGQDGLSGIDTATAPPDTVVTGEGDGLVAGPVAVSDNAGNSTDASVTGLRIDRTAPTISAATVQDDGTARAANPAGWFNSAVRVRFTCADPLSGIQECANDVVLSSDGTGQSATGAASDNADNTATGTISGIDIDSVAPATTARLTCTGENGYCRSDATVDLAAADQPGLSGVKEIHYSADAGATWQVLPGAASTVQVPLSGSGTANVRFYAVDNAGNSEATNVVTINHDTIAPAVTHTVTPTPNAAGWDTADTTVHFSVADDDGGSGVDPTTITPDQVVTGETPGQVVTGSASDNAGNVGTDSVTVKLDRTPPQITASVTSTPNANGWYNSAVRTTFACVDPLSGVAICPADVVLSTDGSDLSASGTAVDTAGNSASASVTGVRIDTTAPSITNVSVADGAIYTLGDSAAPAGHGTCTATDAGSGLAGGCKVTLAGGLANGVGTFTFIATATDRAGNSATRTGSFRVVYPWGGFLQPVNDPNEQPGLAPSIFKAGGTVPVKFQLTSADGTVLAANQAPLWVTPVRGNETTGSVDETTYNDPATNGAAYRWDATAQQYVYNWSTKGLAAGYFYRIGVTLDDGQTHFVSVGLR